MYVYTGSAWVPVATEDASQSDYLKIVDSQPSFRNLLINGDMQIAQRGTSLASITSGSNYIVDRFKFQVNTQGTWTMSQETDAPSGSGFNKSLKILCTTADSSPAAGDYVLLNQTLEGQNLQQIRKGTPSAQPLSLTFWVKSNVTGTYILEMRDQDNTRQVSQSYTISTSGTWEKKSILIPADSIGALDNDNNLSLFPIWWLGAGSNFTSGTLATTWATGTDANKAVGQTNLASATNNYWQITGVQLEVGPIATPFEFKPIDVELTQCKRYYEKSYNQGVNPGTSTTVGSIRFRAPSSSVEIGVPFSITKRAAPTVTLYSTTGASGNIRDLSTSTNGAATTDTVGDSWFFATKTTGGTAGNSYAFHYVADIEL